MKKNHTFTEDTSLIPALRRCALFSRCDESSLERIAQTARVKLLMRGEILFLKGGRYRACMSLLSPSKVIFFPKDTFLALLENDSSICLNLISSLARWLRKMTDLVAELSLKDVESRFAAYILEICKRDGIPVTDDAVVELDIEKRELALCIGTVRETMSRTFRRLIERGLIRIDGKIITIIEADRFSELVFS